jgi:Zn-finger nucleic acid-binding protein
MAAQAKGMGCPVCKEVELQKLRPSQELELLLDHCERCGGMWFEPGEVRQLRLLAPEVLASRISLKKQLFAMPCPECGHPVTRNSGQCKACGHENTIACPRCHSELERVQSDVFTIDVCRACRGVWFDNIDLSAVWNLQFDETKGQKQDGSTSQSGSFDTVLAVLKHSREVKDKPAKGKGAKGKAGAKAEPAGAAVVGSQEEGSAGGRSRNPFGMIADIIGAVFTGHD